jgi:molecular chaperone DnaJ
MATTEQDYYTLLGVPRGASDADIKRAFRRLARELHPDVSTEPDADARFKAIAEAYEVLSDPERRQTYDRLGHAGLRGRGFTPTDFDLGNLGDVFAAFFGEGIFGGGQRRGSGQSRGADVAASVRITLADAVTGRGVNVAIRVARTCGTCGGNGAEPGTEPLLCPGCGGAGQVQQVANSVFGQVVRSATCRRCQGSGRVVESPCTVCEGAGRTLVDDTLEVDVPAGIHHGQQIRVRGVGHDGALGGSRGDVYVEVGIAPLDGVERDGDHLHTVARVTMTEAAVGSTVTVATPEGDLDVELSPGVQPGATEVVRGRGMPSLDTGRRGNLYVHVDVRIPRRLTAEQRERVLRLEEELGGDPYRDDEGLFARIKNAFR